jgi:hypothetical protein
MARARFWVIAFGRSMLKPKANEDAFLSRNLLGGVVQLSNPVQVTSVMLHVDQLPSSVWIPSARATYVADPVATRPTNKLMAQRRGFLRPVSEPGQALADMQVFTTKGPASTPVRDPSTDAVTAGLFSCYGGKESTVRALLPVEIWRIFGLPQAAWDAILGVHK